MARYTNLSCVFLLVCLCITCILAIPPRPGRRPSQQKPSPCPAGWEAHKYRPRICIWLSHETDSWISAGNWCTLFGGQLSVVSQRDHGEMLRMIGMRRARGQPIGKFWTDAVIGPDLSGFKSMYSKREPFIPQYLLMQLPLPYNPYQPYHVPRAPKYDKNCLAMDENGKFIKESCNSDHQFICEKNV